MGPARLLGAECNRLHTFRMRMDGDNGEEGYGDGGDASRDEAWDLRNDRAYWRRRFFILCGGVVALGTCAWLFPAAHQPSAREVAATRASMAALAKQQALPPVAYGSAWPVPSTPAASHTPPPMPTPTTSANPATAIKSPQQKVSTAYRPGPATSASGRAGTCVPADIVLSLFTSQSSYATGEQPKFSVYAVSTSRAPCTLPYGAGSVQVVVMRHGHVVWDSAACTHPAVKPVQFTPGVPQLLTMVWNPKATEPAGCAGSLPAGTSGALDAVAMSDGQSSSVHTFKVGSLTA
jgi:hypothetical protein